LSLEVVDVKVFLITRAEKVDWCEDYAMVVVAEDDLHAERRARWSSDDFKKGDLHVVEISLNEESCVLVANTGS